jgi:hypothetical protein
LIGSRFAKAKPLGAGGTPGRGPAGVPSQDTDAVAPGSLSVLRASPGPTKKTHDEGSTTVAGVLGTAAKCDIRGSRRPALERLSRVGVVGERERRRPRACAWSGPARGRSVLGGGGGQAARGYLAYSKNPAQTDMQAYITSIDSLIPLPLNQNAAETSKALSCSWVWHPITGGAAGC